ncbi:MAG TPA: hypothetical protein VK358_11610, partial [Longimicrobium sp.]|nr:hypothetical protein [Longimicrobium sp.]
MTTFRVRGVAATGPESGAPDLGRFSDDVHVREIEAVRVGEVRGAVARDVEPGPGDVLELELEGGIRLWVSPERLAGSVDAAGVRGVDGARLALPPSLQFGPATRGVGGLGLKVLKRLNVDLAGMAAQQVIQKLEGKLAPSGLYGWSTPELASGAAPRSGRPLLLFLHGTASSTTGSFGGLREPGRAGVWPELARQYGDNVFAYEHRTLSQSPIQNAVELLAALP